VEGSSEHVKESLGCIKCWETLEQLYNCRLLKKGSAPWSWLVITATYLDDLQDGVWIGELI
jgi:hypothetical protein